jgi:energy-coupling factor transporter ATP-binding protein EcfA2
MRSLKGIAGPVRAWAVLQASSVASRFEALHATGLTALVGREEEIELLRRCFFRATDGEGQVVLLSGEAGIGKSRLTSAFDLINKKRAGKPITAKARPRGENVVDLMDALRKSIGGTMAAKDSKPAKKPRKVASGQKEMLMPIAGKKPAKEAAAKKPAAKPQRKSA